MAESAEIRTNREFVESDQRNREREEAEKIGSISPILDKHGLIRKIHNPDVVERCLELLAELRERIDKSGFSPSYDPAVLKKIYGDRDASHLRTDLYDLYKACLQIAEAPEEECERKGYPSPAGCRQMVLQKIDEEIRRLKRDLKARSSVETARTQLEVLRQSVPDAPGTDRLLRYEASLERSFDRTLSQLERLQQMRLGLPVPHRVEVQHTVSQG